jgi:hypothetical protein
MTVRFGPVAKICQPAINGGTSRHFVAIQQFSRFRTEADIQRAALTEPDL